MSDWNEGDFYGDFVPLESSYNPGVTDLTFDHVPTRAEITAAAHGAKVGTVGYPIGAPRWPTGWNQERVNRENARSNIQVFLYVALFIAAIIAPGVLCFWIR